MIEEIEELIVESYENGDISLDEANMLMEAVNPFAVVGSLMAGYVAYTLTDFTVNQIELSKIGNFFKQTDPKFVPFKEFDVKSYKISKQFGEEPKILTDKNANILTHISGNIGRVLFHNEKPVISYVTTRKHGWTISGDEVVKSTLHVKLLDKSFKKYEKYYTACIMSKVRQATPEMKKWVRNEYKKIKNIDGVKTFTESEHKSEIIDNFKTKKCDKNIKFIDISSREAHKYLMQDSCSKKNIKHIAKYQNGEIIIDVDRDVIIGRIFVWNEVNKKNTGFINSLYIDEDYRGYGFANRLLKDAITKYDGYDLCVYKDNKVAIELYKKHGFVIDESKSDKETYYMILKSQMEKKSD